MSTDRSTCGALPLLLAAGAALLSAVAAWGDDFPQPAIEWDPHAYDCFRAESTLVIDGLLNEADWLAAPWTEDFVDIQGRLKPKPRFRTRVKMLWDDDYFYVAADMEEPHVWGVLSERDAVIYYDNDFEVFIDPDGDTHEYYELEINALGTVWDLLLGKPYRDGGPAIDAWDIQGLLSAVHVDGTLNDPLETDVGWSVEIALPWSVLVECAHGPAPPEPLDVWRVNFSRVQWQHRVVDDRYEKRKSTKTGKALREDNWVWSPQGLVAMHYPEMWGFVRFVATAAAADPRPRLGPIAADADEFRLRQIYYKQMNYRAQMRVFAEQLWRLDPIAPHFDDWPRLRTDCKMVSDGESYTVSLPQGEGVRLFIDERGRIWRSEP